MFSIPEVLAIENHTRKEALLWQQEMVHLKKRSKKHWISGVK